MNIQMKRHAISTGLLLCTALGAVAVPVTFQVDMGQQTAFDSATNTVQVRGPFNNWSGTALANVPGTTIYTNTLNITNSAGSWVQYKFYVGNNSSINYEQLGNWHPGGNRVFQVPTNALTLPVAYYADAGPGGTAVTVTFQIDMGPQMGIGVFDPTGRGDYVQAMGAFNNSWSPVTLSPDSVNPTLYTGSYTESGRPPGSLIEYKYAINVGGGGTLQYESLSTASFPDNPPNRAFILQPTDMTLPRDYFSDASGLPIKAGIYFQVDMSSQIFITAFNPAIDLASVRGDAIGWGNPPDSGLQLFEDTARPGIYTNTWLSTNQLTGGAFTYKYTFLHGTTTTWEDGNNKSVAFVGNEPTNSAGYHMITLGPTLFNNFQADTNDYLPADTLVTFTVSMTNAQSYAGFTPQITFDKGTMTVAVNGNWVPWWSWTTPAPTELLLTNGTGGDRIYSQTVLIPKGKPVQLVYKYGIDDGLGDSRNNEAPDGSDRIRYIRKTGSYTLPMDTFGTQTVENSFGSLSVGKASGGYSPISWLGRPGVFLQTASTLKNPNWVTHYEPIASVSPSGIYSTNYPTTTGATFFRLVKP
jgi:hypothetical protein